MTVWCHAQDLNQLLMLALDFTHTKVDWLAQLALKAGADYGQVKRIVNALNSRALPR